MPNFVEIALTVAEISRFSIFQDGEIQTAETVRRVIQHHCQISSKSLELRPRYGHFSIFSIFQDGRRRNFWYSKFQIFNGPARHECRTASPCQISSKSFEPRPRYVSFNITLAWKCLFTPIFVFFWGTFPPNDVTHRPNPKKDHPWAEPRHLSHKPRIYSYRIFEWALQESSIISLTLWSPRNGFLGVLNMVGVNISNLSSE